MVDVHDGEEDLLLCGDSAREILECVCALYSCLVFVIYIVSKDG